MTEPARQPNGEVVPADDLSLQAVLDRFDGDRDAALTAALDDLAYLRRELTVASLAMSYGFARGWRPATLEGRLTGKSVARSGG